jgi:hypothetical protein
MKRDGEKMPPDDPEPRLRHVARSLQANSSRRSEAAFVWLRRIDSIVE